MKSIPDTAGKEAQLHFEAGNFDLSLSSSDKLIKSLPDASKGHFMKGRALAALKRNDEAVICFKTALKLDSAHTKEVKTGLQAIAEERKTEGNDAYHAKDYPKAIKLYSEAIDIYPDEILYHSNLAAVYMMMNEFDGAIAECEKAINKTKISDHDSVKIAKVHSRIASAYEKKGDM